MEFTSHDLAVNMKLTKATIDGFTLPMLENVKALKAVDKLVVKDPRAEATPAQKKARR